MVSKLGILFGGAGGIRTLAPVARSNDLANRPLQPLEYRSISLLAHFTLSGRACQMFFSCFRTFRYRLHIV